MIERMAGVMQPLLNMSIVKRIRRNHGLEHATIHMLTRRIRNLNMAGRADTGGFYLYGEAETSVIWEAAQEALSRMQNGEHKLAVHPNCGTGLVTTSLMTSSAAIVALLGTRNRPSDMFNRLPLVMLLTIGALILSQPVGLSVQQNFTVLGEPGDLEIVDITRHESSLPFSGKLTIHRVHTRNG